jgi:hypothetical protein
VFGGALLSGLEVGVGGLCGDGLWENCIVWDGRWDTLMEFLRIYKCRSLRWIG